MKVDVEQIVDAACSVYGVSREAVLDSRRLRQAVQVRRMVMYVMRRICKMPLRDIAYYFGGMHHTTIMHHVDRCEEGLQYYEDLQEERNWVLGLMSF